MEDWERQEERTRSRKKKKERWYPNSRARPPRSGDCDKSWTSFLRKGGTEVAYQVAAPTESSTPNLHRATIAQQRVRMEGWRQERLGSRAGTHREEEKNKNILTGRKKEGKKENILDTHRPSHGRTLPLNLKTSTYHALMRSHNIKDCLDQVHRFPESQCRA